MVKKVHVEKDFEEFLEFLNRYDVRFCIVGAYALAFHGKPRFTKDLDIFVESTSENGANIIKALQDFGFKTIELKKEDFACAGTIIQLGYSPVRVDIITSISGCLFDEVWNTRKIGRYGSQKVSFIGLEKLIKNKEASGRAQDLIDLKFLHKKMLTRKS